MRGLVPGIHAIVSGMVKAEFRRRVDGPHAGAAGMHSLAIAHHEGHWTCYLKWGIVCVSFRPQSTGKIHVSFGRRKC
jgi:hypothetical protein